MILKAELAKCQSIVNTELERFLSNITGKKEEDQFIRYSYDLLHEYVLRGGKRLRAIFCIKSHEAFSGKKDKRILMPAISAELFHASSLVHDDIMDEDDVRRNKASMHKLYEEWFLNNFKENDYCGNIFSKESSRFATSAGIIKGNILFSLGLFCLTTCGFKDNLKNEALNLCQKFYRQVNEGQLRDLLNESKQDIGEKDYIEMVALKTGKLFASFLEFGAIFAETSMEKRQLIHDVGMNMAIAFQIRDDVMDISKDMKKGNTLGSDIRKGKMTILMIHALKNANKEQRDCLNKICGKANTTISEIQKVVEIFKETKAIERANLLAGDYIKRGRNCLLKLKKDISIEGYEFFKQAAYYMNQRRV